jgi:pimeloyl-ACP methyl ester carboxylesterase
VPSKRMFDGSELRTLYAISPDGNRVAYDRVGSGPAIMLLHGGGGKRQDWHDAGYIERLRVYFTVITIDLRGHGESGLPTDSANYTTDKMGQDFLAVADDCGIEQFTIWAMSYGGKVGHYLAAQSKRVSKIILMGTPLGLGVSGQLRPLASYHANPTRGQAGSRLTLPERPGIPGPFQYSGDAGLG